MARMWQLLSIKPANTMIRAEAKPDAAIANNENLNSQPNSLTSFRYHKTDPVLESSKRVFAFNTIVERNYSEHTVTIYTCTNTFVLIFSLTNIIMTSPTISINLIINNATDKYSYKICGTALKDFFEPYRNTLDEVNNFLNEYKKAIKEFPIDDEAHLNRLTLTKKNIEVQIKAAAQLWTGLLTGERRLSDPLKKFPKSQSDHSKYLDKNYPGLSLQFYNALFTILQKIEDLQSVELVVDYNPLGLLLEAISKLNLPYAVVIFLFTGNKTRMHFDDQANIIIDGKPIAAKLLLQSSSNEDDYQIENTNKFKP